MALQSPGQLHASEVGNANRSARQSADHAVYQCTESQMSANARPATGQLGVGIPSHAELQRQGIANHDPCRRLARDAIRSRSRNRPRRLRLWGRVNQHVHARSDVQVAQLQSAGQGNYHGSVNIAQAALTVRLFCRPFLEFILQSAGRERFRRYAAGQWRIVVDVELEQMEERVVDKVDRAVDLLFHAEEELERTAGFVARWEGDVGQLACSVGDVLAGITDRLSTRISLTNPEEGYSKRTLFGSSN